MDRKRISAKEIFRTLAFHYHYDEKLPLDLLCDMVSGIYYPKDPTGEARKRYKTLLITLMKEYTSGEKYITEPQFCEYMTEMAKLKKEEYSLKLTNRIFDRYAEIDPDSKEKVICEEGFKKIMSCMKIKGEESLEYFKTVADRKNQIAFEKFNEYMNALIIKELKASE